MDDIGVKAIVIAVSIFVTLLIVTVLVLEFTHISDIYVNVAETDISFEEQFDELDKFKDSNNIFTELDVRNYIKKYSSDDTIDVCVDTNCDDESNIASLNNYKTDYKEYTANLVSTQKGYKIVFNIK